MPVSFGFNPRAENVGATAQRDLSAMRDMFTRTPRPPAEAAAPSAAAAQATEFVPIADDVAVAVDDAAVAADLPHAAQEAAPRGTSWRTRLLGDPNSPLRTNFSLRGPAAPAAPPVDAAPARDLGAAVRSRVLGTGPHAGGLDVNALVNRPNVVPRAQTSAVSSDVAESILKLMRGVR